MKLEDDIISEFEKAISISYKINGDSYLHEAKAVACSSFFRDFYLYLFHDHNSEMWGSLCFPKQSKWKFVRKILPSKARAYFKLRENIELPDEIVLIFKEAFGCYTHGFYTATVVMCRRLLEQVLISKGATPGINVCKMVKELADRGIIDSRMVDWANKIKGLGNIGAHIKDEELNMGDAQDALTFSDLFITWLYGKVYENPKASSRIIPDSELSPDR